VERFGLSKGVHIVTRPLTRRHAIALATAHRSESFLTRGGRHFFVIPWRGRSLIGTTDVPHTDSPGRVQATVGDIGDFVDEINRAWPAAGLRPGDVHYFWAGLYPLVGKDVRADVYQGGGRSRLFDHRKRDGIEGLVSGIAAKYTTARRLAVRMVDLAFREIGRRAPATRTDRTPVFGGDTGPVEPFLAGASAACAGGIAEEAVAELVANHGSRTGMSSGWPRRTPGSPLPCRSTPPRSARRSSTPFARRWR
jgi:glycerol-3-phosphate dehydrogenase